MEKLPIFTLKLFLVILFSLSSQLALFLLAFYFGGFSKDILKQQLQASEIYQATSERIIDPLLKDIGSDDLTNELSPIIKKQFTPAYMQQKVETLIDDTYLWSTNKSKTPPVLSFKEIKTSILQQKPQLLSDLKGFIQETKSAQLEAMVEAPETKETLTQTLDTYASEKFIESDFTINLENKLLFIKQITQFYQFSLPVSLIIVVIVLISITFFNQNLSKRMLWLGITFLSSVFFSIVPLLISFLIFKDPIKTISRVLIHNELKVEAESMSSIFIPFINKIFTTFTGKLIQLEVIWIVFSLIAGITFLIVSKISTQKVNQAKN